MSKILIDCQKEDFSAKTQFTMLLIINDFIDSDIFPKSKVMWYMCVEFAA